MTDRPVRAASGARRAVPELRRGLVHRGLVGALALVTVLGIAVLGAGPGFAGTRTPRVHPGAADATVPHTFHRGTAATSAVSGRPAGFTVSDPEIPTEKPKVPAPSAPPEQPGGAQPTNLPLPGDQGVDEGVSGPMTVILGWTVWTVFALCVAGVLLAAAQMALRHRHGEAGKNISGLVWVMVACVVAASASAITGGVLS